MSVARDSGLRERAARSLGHSGHREVGHAGDLAMRGLVRAAEQVGRVRAEVGGPVGARHHDRGGAVGDEAAIAHAEGVGNHARFEVVLHRQLVAHRTLRG